MVLFTTGNKLRKFDTVNEIIEIFCNKRLKLYKKRKKRLLKTLKENLQIFWSPSMKRFADYTGKQPKYDKEEYADSTLKEHT